MLAGDWGPLVIAIIASQRLEALSLAAHLFIAAGTLALAHATEIPLARRLVVNLVSALVSIWVHVLTAQEVLTVPLQTWNVVLLVVLWTTVPKKTAYGEGIISAVSYMASVLLARLLLSRRPTPDRVALAAVLLGVAWILFDFFSASHKSLLWRPAALVLAQLAWRGAPDGIDVIFVLAVALAATATVTGHKAAASIASTVVAVRASQTSFGTNNIYILVLCVVCHALSHPFAKNTAGLLRRTLVIQFVLFAIAHLATLDSLVLLAAVVSFLLDD